MPSQAKFKIVLVAPDIPGNTGSIGRTCVALGIPLILIKPYGFDLSEKAVRRAGLDYWKHLQLEEFESFEDFLKAYTPTEDKMFFFSKLGKKSYYQGDYPEGSFIIFGSETKGLAPELHSEFEKCFYSLPMYDDRIRSLNLSNTATAVAYHALGIQSGEIFNQRNT